MNVGLGAVIPIGSSADLLNPGYSALASISAHPWGMRNSVRLEVATSSLASKPPALGKQRFVSGTANLVLVGDSTGGPIGYVILGIGSYQKSGSVPRRTDAGFNVGAGIRFSMGFFGTFVEARLHCLRDKEKTKLFPMTFGLTF